MNRSSPMLLLALLTCFAAPTFAAEEPKPDDRVILDLASESWVTTKTARVIISIEAAVTGSSAGNARAEMLKAVSGISEADWRLISFNRSQDQTGMERWSAAFEARISEHQLNGLNEAAKKQSKAGMQLSVNTIDFTPTLAETQAATNALRTDLYKSANEQLEALNKTLPGRAYRIALINFSGNSEEMEIQPMAPRPMRAKLAMMSANAAAGSDAAAPMERAQKLVLGAHVVFATAPTAPAK